MHRIATPVYLYLAKLTGTCQLIRKQNYGRNNSSWEERGNFPAI